MQLQKLVFEDLGGFQSKVELDFTNNFNFVYLSGQIGSGKSSILDTISWVLFDRTIRGFAKSDWVNDCCDSGYAELSLLDNNICYTIKRFRNKTTCVLEVDQDGENLTKKTIQETQNFIEKEILCTTFDIFRNSVMFGQGDVLTLAEGTDKDRKQIIGDILGFEGIDNSCVKVRNNVSLLKDDTNIKETLLKDKEGKFSSLSDVNKEVILSSKQKLSNLKQDLEDRDKFIEETNKLISASAQISRLKEVKQSIRTKSQELLVIEKDINSIDLTLFDLIPKYKQKVEQLTKDKNSIEVAVKVAEQTCSINKKQLANLTSLSKGKCPTCLQDIDEAKKVELVKDLQNKIEGAEKQINSNSLVLTDLTTNILKISKDIKELLDIQARHLNLLQRKKEYEELIDRLIKEKDSLSAIVPFTDDEHTEELLKGQLRKLKEERETVNYKINELSREIGSYEEKLKTREVLEREIIINKEEIKNNYFILRHLAFLENLLSLKGVKNKILERVIPFMQQETNKYLSSLLPNTVIEIATLKQGKTIIKQELTFNIRDLISNKTRDFKGWSGGQKKLISLALRLGLWRVNYYYSKKKFEFIFLDEIFGALDPEDREVPLAFLKDLQARLNVPIVVVDHIPELKEEFSQTIAFTFNPSKGCLITGKEGF